MANITFEEMNGRLLSQVPGILESWIPGGKLLGKEYKGKNPTRADSTIGSFSVNVHTGQWADFATNDKGGDLVSLYAYLKHIGNGDAIKELSGNETLTSAKPAKKPPEDPWKVIVPVPDDIPDPDCKHFEYGLPSAIWHYYTATGGLIGAVCRWDRSGKKHIQPIAYFENKTTGKREWRWKHWDKPRSLYNLDLLTKNAECPVWIVEGEKCADAMQALFPNCVTVTWPGGAQAVKHVDLAPLAGRKVYIWPDNDTPGQAAKAFLYSALRGKASSIHRFIIPENKPGGWDCADAIQDGITCDAVMSATVEMRDAPQEGEAAVLPPPDPNGIEWPFRFLGYDHGEYFYQSFRQNQVISLSAMAHNKSNLLTLAPLAFWETMFPSKQGPDWTVAMDAMISIQVSDAGPGPYNPSMLCGRGVCWDKGRAVVHMGDRLIVDDKETGLCKIKSRHIYESAAPRLDLVDQPPLSASEAKPCFDLITMLTWEQQRYAVYLAGWIMTAPICGALRWRPHLWSTGTAGSGKTWVSENIIRKILGDWSLFVQGGVTEAGIRQKLNNDLIPVIVDEAEQENKQQASRIDSILFLMRQASTDSGAQVIKGSVSGRAITYNVRSMFMFSSISVGARYHADNTRISVITLREDQQTKFGETFEKIKETTARLLTREYCDRMIKRSITMLPTIRKNADTLSDAVSEVLRSKRTGDQVGTLLAGQLAMVSDAVLTKEQAMDMVRKHDWSEEKVAQDQRDEYMCLKAILQTNIRTPLEKSSVDRNVGELIAVISGESDSEPELTAYVAECALRRFGIRIIDGMVYFSNTSRNIQDAMEHTAYGTGYFRQLRRIVGSQVIDKVVRFNPGLVSRCIAIPLSTVLEDERLLDDGLEIAKENKAKPEPEPQVVMDLP
jgi:putative DNA primase/helicase